MLTEVIDGRIKKNRRKGRRRMEMLEKLYEIIWCYEDKGRR